MSRLPPLRVRFLMTVTAVSRRRKRLRIDELARVRRRVGWQKGLLLAEVEIIGLRNVLAVDVSRRDRIFTRLRSSCRQKMRRGCGDHASQQRAEQNLLDISPIHRSVSADTFFWPALVGAEAITLPRTPLPSTTV